MANAGCGAEIFTFLARQSGLHNGLCLTVLF